MLDMPAIRKGPLLAASMAVAVLYLWGLGGFGLLDPDEGMNAEIAREMLVSGDWIVPRFNGVPYIEKPPLMYWLTAGTYAVLGTSEFSARLWKVIPSLGTIVMTYVLGRRLFSEAVGGLSAIILATTLGPFLFSRITEVDPLLVFAITLSASGIIAAGQPIDERPRGTQWRASLCFWIGIAIGLMSKGLPGLVFPLGLLILWSVTKKDAGVIRGVWSIGGIVVALALALPWHVAAATRVPGFFDFYVLDNQLLRFLGARGFVEDGKSLGTLAFLGATFLALFPWAPFLAAALTALGSSMFREASGVRRKPRTCLTLHVSRLTFHVSRFTPHASRVQFLVGWIALVIGIFAVSSFKLEYYSLPVFPAVALLVAAFLANPDYRGKPEGAPLEKDHPGEPLVRHQTSFDLLRIWTWVAVAGGLLFASGAAWARWAGLFTPQNIIRGLSIWATNYRVLLEQGLPLPPVSANYFSALLLGGGLMWTVGFAAALGWLRRGQVLPATLAVAMVGAGLCFMTTSVLRQVESHHSLKPLAERLNGVLRPEDILVHERGLEKGGGLLFYTGRKALVLNGVRGDLEFGSRLPGYERTFIDTVAFRKLWASGMRVFLVTNLPRPRNAVSQLSDPIPIELATTGTRWLYANRKP